MADFESLDAVMERMRADLNAHYERVIAIIKTGLEEIMRQGRETDHSPPTSAEVKKMWIYTSTPPYVFMT
jgi:hypothetical protein